MAEDFDECALDHHRNLPPGKIAVTLAMPLGNQHDLAPAYSLSLAASCREIVDGLLTAS